MKQQPVIPLPILKKQYTNEQAEKLFTAIHSNQLDEVKNILSEGVVDINTREKEFGANNRNGDSVLHAAARLGDIDMFVYLTEKVAKINAIDSWGRQPIHVAVANGHIAIINYLIDEKAVNVNTVDQDLSTPINIAAMNGNLELVKLLLTKEADPLQGKGIDIELLRKQNYIEIADLIREKVDYLYANDPYWKQQYYDIIYESITTDKQTTDKPLSGAELLADE